MIGGTYFGEISLLIPHQGRFQLGGILRATEKVELLSTLLLCNFGGK